MNLEKKHIQIAVASAAAFCGGFGLGYFFKTKKEENRNEDSTLESRMSEIDKVMSKPFSTSEVLELVRTVVPDIAEEVSEEVEVEHIHEDEVGGTTVVTNRVSVFSENTWDQEVEDAYRATNTIYPLQVDEFMNDERNYRQVTWTYYEKDNILADEGENVVYNYQSKVGELRFGHGSNDRNSYYVRNEEMVPATEFEILRDTRSYTEMVLGEQIEHDYAEQDERELKHSARRFYVED